MLLSGRSKLIYDQTSFPILNRVTLQSLVFPGVGSTNDKNVSTHINMIEKLSEYEKKRLEKIHQNQLVLQSLAIPDLSPSPSSFHGSAPASLKLPSNKKRKSPINSIDEPRRISARLQEKANNPHPNKLSLADELALYRDHPISTVLPKKERPLRILGNIPFAPDRDEQVIKETLSGVLSDHMQWKERPAPFTTAGQYHIEGEYAVAKVVEDRVYSLALHPTTERILITAGSKTGGFGVWDATEAWKDGDSIRKTFYFRPHTGSITVQRYSPSCPAHLFTASYDGLIRCLNLHQAEFTVVYQPPSSYDGGEQLICTLEVDSTGQLLYFTDCAGILTRYDTRTPPDSSDGLTTFQLHDKKAGGFSISPVDPNYLASSSLDDTICIWDARKLRSYESDILVRLEYSRAITSVFFHPCLRDVLVSTAYDDTVRIHTGILNDNPEERHISHNNQTGRWITPFRAIWDPKSGPHPAESRIFVGNMNRGLDCIGGLKEVGPILNNQSKFLTAQPAVNAVHSQLDLIVSGTASGKCFLWKPLIK